MPVAIDETESIRVRVPAQLKERWEQMLDDRKISQQRAVIALMEWIIEEDPLLQSQIFRQVPVSDRPELSRIVLKRLGKRR